jgi:hypothetical protein
MRILSIFLLLALFSIESSGQSDLLIFKKNNRTIQSFYPDSKIQFMANDMPHEGYITAIERDSLFLIQYDIRQVYTNLGVYILDTVARYRYAVPFKEITGIIKDRSSFVGASGVALLGGGILLTTGGLLTWVFAKPNTRYYARPEFVIGAAVAAAVGYAMMKASGSSLQKLGKKYTLTYIHMK